MHANYTYMKKSTDGNVEPAKKVIEKLGTIAEVNEFVKGDTRKGVLDAARKRAKQLEDAADAAKAAKDKADAKPSNDPENKPEAEESPAPAKDKGEKREVPNQFLADRSAGKVDEAGNPIK